MAIISNNKYTSETPEKLTDLLIRDKITVNDLDPKNNNHLQAVIDFYRRNHSRIKEISSSVEYDFFLNILKRDYKFFVYLDKKQYRDDIAQEYLIGLFKDPKFIKKGDTDFNTYLSFDDKIVFLYEYQTKKGDELFYFDNELKVPASLISKVKSTIRIEKPVEFIKMLDVNARFLEPTHIFSKLYYFFNTSFRKVLLEMVTKEGVGYYKITNSIVEIEKKTSSEINAAFNDKCATTTSLVIQKIEVDREVRDKIEDEFFELRRKRINIDEELKYQKDSMDLFAKKLEIIHKYSASPELLTEAEKDKAFDRYARKGKFSTGDKRSSSKLVDKKDEKYGNGIDLEEDKVPTMKKGAFFWIRLIAGVACGFISLILACVLFPRGQWKICLLLLGLFALTYGITLIVTAVIERNKGTVVVKDIKQSDEVK